MSEDVSTVRSASTEPTRLTAAEVLEAVATLKANLARRERQRGMYRNTLIEIMTERNEAALELSLSRRDLIEAMDRARSLLRRLLGSESSVGCTLCSDKMHLAEAALEALNAARKGER